MGATDWRGDREGREGDGVPRFGRKAQAWFRRCLIARLFTPSPHMPGEYVERGGGCVWAPDAVEMLVAWYLERRERFVGWQDDDAWRGGRYPAGQWTLGAEAIQGAWREACTAVDRQIDADIYPTLDEWLAADIAGDLYYRGAPSGMERVPRELRREPRRTCACGERFTPKRCNGRNCPRCVELHRQERERRRA